MNDQDFAQFRRIEEEIRRLQSTVAALERREQPRPYGVFNLPIGAAVLAGGATVVTVQTNHRALNLADAATQAVFWSFKLPPGWGGKTLTVDYLWAPSSTNTGNALITTAINRQAAGVTLSATAAATGGGLQAANGVADRPQLNSSALSLSTFADGEAFIFRIARLGSDGTDTFTGAVQVLAVELSVVG